MIAIIYINAISNSLSHALLRGGEMPDSFIINPDKARKRLGLDDDDVKQVSPSEDIAPKTQIKCAPRTGMGSRYPGK